MVEAGKRDGVLRKLVTVVRVVGPWIALAAGLLLIPLKLAELFSERRWVFDLASLSATAQQIDGAGWISIALIAVEGMVAGAVFMFAVSYSLTFQQNIGKIGDDIINVLQATPAPILNPPSDSITVDASAKAWLDTVLKKASEQAAQHNDDLEKQVVLLGAALDAAKSELELEREAKANLSAQLETLSAELSNTYGKSIKQEEVIELLKPVIRAIKQLGVQASRLDPDPVSDESATAADPTLQ